MIDVVGLLVILLFYALILVVGILATRWYKRKVLGGASDGQEVVLVAGRKLGAFVGIFTMTATTVGGGYINGTAESIATFGLAWTLAPFGICVGLIIGGLVFARPMRERCYLTMFDPFEQKFGPIMVALLYLAAICGDIFWSASVLNALGTSLGVIIQLNTIIAVVISAVVAMGYTMFGQLVSVVYTDVIQLIFITVGLVLALPFILTNEAVLPVASTKSEWIGSVPRTHWVAWADLLMAMTFGTIPWQTYFQRVLAVKTAKYAQVLSIAGGLGAFILGIPPALVGMAAVSTDWNQTELGVSPIETGQASLVLPLVLRYLTPRGVALTGLGALAAAVMSSIDSAILSSATIFTHNIYKLILRKKASERELAWMQRLSVLIIGTIATVIAIFVTSIYGLFIMAADIIFVIMFPQLIAAVFIPKANAYGSLIGFCVGLFLRFAAGEPILGMKPLIYYPYYDGYEQLFPFRTFAMLCSLLSIVGVSYLSWFIFKKNEDSVKYDFMGAFKCDSYTFTPVGENHEMSPADKHLSDKKLDLMTDFTNQGLDASGDDTTGSAATENGHTIQNYSENSCKRNC